MPFGIDPTSGFGQLIADALNEPSGLTFLLIGGLFIYVWRRDVTNPEKTGSNAVLSGAVESSASAYSMAKDALDTARQCERRNIAQWAYIRKLQGTLDSHGIPVPPVPEDILD